MAVTAVAKRIALPTFTIHPFCDPSRTSHDIAEGVRRGTTLPPNPPPCY